MSLPPSARTQQQELPPGRHAHASALSSSAAPSRRESTHEALELPRALIRCFSCCTAQWGLVTDARSDGSTFQRHGIVVEATVKLTGPLKKASSGSTLLLRSVRLGVDMVKLALVADPVAVETLLMRRSSNDNNSVDDMVDLSVSKEELRQAARGEVPFELRVRLEVESTVMEELDHALKTCFLEELDAEQVDGTDSLRSCLVDRVLRSASSRRLAQLPVPTQLVVMSYGPPQDEWKLSQQFFPALAATSQSLCQYQAPQWAMAEHFAPLVIQTIDLQLLDVPLVPHLFHEATVALTIGLPTSCSKVTLSVRSMECEEEELQAFLDVLTANSAQPIAITTGPSSRNLGFTSVPDFGRKCPALLRCIGRMQHQVSIDLSGLLVLCDSRQDARALYRGIVHYVLPRSSLASLSVHSIFFEADDAQAIQQEVVEWRRENPDQKLRLRSLKLWLMDMSMSTVRRILEALDDAEDVVISMYGIDYVRADDIRMILRFPSLRSASIINANIPSMDVFTSGNIPNLCLKKLELGSLTLEDSASLVAFVKSLDPHSGAASSLSRSLQSLSIAEVDGSDFRWEGPCVKPRLAVNDIAAVQALEEMLRSNQTLRYANFIGDFGQRPVMPATGPEHPARISHVVAPTSVRRSALEKARKAAFLSGLHEGTCATARAVDNNTIQQIFEFSAPQVSRKVRV